jgi:hypothetical protein
MLPHGAETARICFAGEGILKTMEGGYAGSKIERDSCRMA